MFAEAFFSSSSLDELKNKSFGWKVSLKGALEHQLRAIYFSRPVVSPPCLLGKFLVPKIGTFMSTLWTLPVQIINEVVTNIEEDFYLAHGLKSVFSFSLVLVSVALPVALSKKSKRSARLLKGNTNAITAPSANHFKLKHILMHHKPLESFRSFSSVNSLWKTSCSIVKFN